MKSTVKYYILIAVAIAVMISVTVFVAVPKLNIASQLLTTFMFSLVIGVIIVCTGIIVSKLEDIKNHIDKE